MHKCHFKIRLKTTGTGHTLNQNLFSVLFFCANEFLCKLTSQKPRLVVMLWFDHQQHGTNPAAAS